MLLAPVARDDATAAFFDGTRDSRFLLRWHRDNGEYHDPRTVPALSGTSDVELVAAAGGGRVVSWATVHHRRPDGAEPDRVVVGIVELDEGPWWWCHLADVDPDANLESLRVQVRFVPSGADPEHEVVPVFAPAEDAS